MDGLTYRAFGAYFRSGGVAQPANDSGPITDTGREYVVLRNVNGILAVYRVRTSGALRRLRRWPQALEQW